MMLADPLLKTQPIAEALGVSVSTIKRWIDSGALRASRTVGKHRLVSFSEAVRFARRQGLSLEKLEALGGDPLIPVSGKVGREVCDTLLAALQAGDRKRSRAIIAAAFESGEGVPALADELIRPVMQQIGHSWEDGSLDVFHEHQASQIIFGALTSINETLARSVQPNVPIAVGCTPSGDPYHLPLLLGEMVLREAGWDVRNLGTSLPFSSLSKAIREIRPALAFISVSLVADEVDFVERYQEAFDAASTVRTAILLGGRGLTPDLRAGIICSGFGDRMIHLAEFARSLISLRSDARPVSDQESF